MRRLEKVSASAIDRELCAIPRGQDRRGRLSRRGFLVTVDSYGVPSARLQV